MWFYKPGVPIPETVKQLSEEYFVLFFVPFMYTMSVLQEQHNDTFSFVHLSDNGCIYDDSVFELQIVFMQERITYESTRYPNNGGNISRRIMDIDKLWMVQYLHFIFKRIAESLAMKDLWFVRVVKNTSQKIVMPLSRLCLVQARNFAFAESLLRRFSMDPHDTVLEQGFNTRMKTPIGPHLAEEFFEVCRKQRESMTFCPYHNSFEMGAGIPPKTFYMAFFPLFGKYSASQNIFVIPKLLVMEALFFKCWLWSELYRGFFHLHIEGFSLFVVNAKSPEFPTQIVMTTTRKMIQSLAPNSHCDFHLNGRFQDEVGSFSKFNEVLGNWFTNFFSIKSNTPDKKWHMPGSLVAHCNEKMMFTFILGTFMQLVLMCLERKKKGFSEDMLSPKEISSSQAFKLWQKGVADKFISMNIKPQVFTAHVGKKYIYKYKVIIGDRIPKLARQIDKLTPGSDKILPLVDALMQHRMANFDLVSDKCKDMINQVNWISHLPVSLN